MTTIVAQRLRIVPGFRPDEYDAMRTLVSSKLENRLARWPADQVELELSVKDRDTDQQRVTLQAWISVKGRSRFVATSTERDLTQAVAEARDDLHRQIDRYVTRKEGRRRSG